MNTEVNVSSSQVINFTLEATALIIHTLMGCFIPTLQGNSTRTDAAQSLSALLSIAVLYFIALSISHVLVLHVGERNSSIPARDCWSGLSLPSVPWSSLLTSSELHWYWHFWKSVCTPWPGFELFYLIPNSSITFCILFLLTQHSQHGASLCLIVASLFHDNILYFHSNSSFIYS